jgi:hypothetical protein
MTPVQHLQHKSAPHIWKLFLRPIAALTIGLFSMTVQAEQPTDSLPALLDDGELLKRISDDELAKEYAKRREETVWKHPPQFEQGGGAFDTLVNLTKYYAELEEYQRKKSIAIVPFADSGYALAQGMLAYYLRDYWSPFVERDVCRSLRYAFDGAEGNSMVAMAILADAYQTGEGISRDEKRSYFWAKETLRRFQFVGDVDYDLAGIIKKYSTPQRAEFDREWLIWAPQKDIRDQKKLVCQEQ